MPANDESALLDTEVHYLGSDHVVEELSTRARSGA